MVGGQAVIEGVMMRSPENISIAVRRPDGKIQVKIQPFNSITKRMRLLGWPIIRGAVVLFEALILGIKALSYSSEVAIAAETNGQKDSSNSFWQNFYLIITLVFALGIGIALFFYLPLVLTDLTGVKSGIWFNLIDGALRMVIFLGYLLLISRFKDIRRVFEYHGAEHKCVFAFENARNLGIENVRAFSTLHPRCGTSFLLIVMVVSIFVFIFLGRPDDVSARFLRLSLIPLIGGISYEFIRLSEKGCRHPLLRFFILPGLWLQKITTSEPDDQQIEVALVALRTSLNMDTADCPSPIVIDIPTPIAQAKESYVV